MYNIENVGSKFNADIQYALPFNKFGVTKI